MYQIAYCDDEIVVQQAFVQKLISAFEACGESVSLTSFTSPVRLLQSVCAGCSFDALFLDIEMAEMDGITLCRRMMEQGFQPVVVFLSQREELVYRTFSVQPVRFLRKSRFAAEIRETVSAVLQRIQKDCGDTVTLEDGKRLYRFPVREIMYLEIMNQTLSVCLRQGSISLKYKISDAERLLEPYGFLRIHKSYLVNYRAIFSIEKDRVMLDNGGCLPLSRHRYTEVKQAFMARSRQELQEAGGF